MKKVLYINGNPQSEAQSYSRKLGKYYLEQLEKKSPQTEVEIINVYEDHIPLIDTEVLEAWGALRAGDAFETLSKSQMAKVGRMNKVLEQFKNADEYVFVTPMWNFSLPPMLKAYVDNVMIAGETFKYTESGPVGLMTDKKAVVIQASGGVYSDGPAAAFEHGSNLLEGVLGFMGIVDVEKVLIEGVAMPTQSEEEKTDGPKKQIDTLLA